MALNTLLQKPGLKYGRKFFLFITSISLLLFFNSCSSNEKENTVIAKTTDDGSTVHSNSDSIIPSITIAAADLSKEYLANEVKADHDYNRKEIKVTGSIADIKKSLNGDAYVILAGAEKFTPVQCYLENTEAALALKKGDTVQIKGTCTGLHANVIIEKCVLLK